MKKAWVYAILIVYLTASLGLIVVDYINLPTLIGLDMGSINWDFSAGIIANVIVVVLYLITYETLDRRAAEKEKNKKDISRFLIKQSYEQCLWYHDKLTNKFVVSYIVPKMDFDGGPEENKVIVNLKKAPFENDEAIISHINDGQVSLGFVEGYYKIKQLYSQYITMITTFYDAPELHVSVSKDLLDTIKSETDKLEKEY